MPAVDDAIDTVAKENTNNSPRQEQISAENRKKNGTKIGKSPARSKLHRRASSSHDVELNIEGKAECERQLSGGASKERRASVSASRTGSASPRRLSISDRGQLPGGRGASMTSSVSPRRLSLADGGESPRGSISYVRRSSAAGISPRRRSSTSVSPISPLGRNVLGIFIFSTPRSKDFSYNEDGIISGGLEMLTSSSLRAIEFLCAEDKKTLNDISSCIDVMKEEKRNIELLRDVFVQCLIALKNIERLSQGIPLMRSVRKACTAVKLIIEDKTVDLDNGLKAVKNANISMGKRMVDENQKFQDMIRKGAEELSFIDARFLEDLRETIGNLLGNTVTTLEILY